MKNVLIIEARLENTLLPASVMRDVQGKTVLERVVQQVQRCQFVDQIVVATTDSPANRPLIRFCHAKKYSVCAGPENDVIGQLADTARSFNADNIIRIAGNCPLIDAGVIDQVLTKLTGDDFLDFTSNVFPVRMYPVGMETEAYSLKTLTLAERLTSAPAERSDPAGHILKNPNLYQIGSVQPRQDHSHLRWSVNTLSDLERINAIYRHFGQNRFRWHNIVDAYPSHPQWLSVDFHQPPKRVA